MLKRDEKNLMVILLTLIIMEVMMMNFIMMLTLKKPDRNIGSIIK